ncbi:hypothetical protein [uncultured Vagococcus sp.]|uniref:hypothetical protein n=1 Tax=uncultured Vagococcus sp. TaxID=189676 RepID=UPI0028D27EFD|nr:hypothetical protein [uncultured Vagococcus sp.]
MDNYYYEEANSGSSIGILLVLVGIVVVSWYLLAKRLLPWINLKLDTHFKWWQIPIAIIMALFAIYAMIAASDHKNKQEISERHARLNQLSDYELERVMQSSDSMEDKRSAKIILQSRIDAKKRMWTK